MSTSPRLNVAWDWASDEPIYAVIQVRTETWYDSTEVEITYCALTKSKEQAEEIADETGGHVIRTGWIKDP